MADEAKSSRVGFSRILGLNASLALGFSVSIGLVLNSGAGVVMSIEAGGVLGAIALATLLYFPVILTYAEMAAGKPGSASAYQISRVYGSTGLTFLIGWVMLSGLVAAAALLSGQLAERFDFTLQNFFNVDIDHIWFLIGAMALGALNEWMIDEDRWRSRTVLVWSAVGLFLVILVWAAVAHPPGQGAIPRIEFKGHGMTAVALLAVGLWFVDILLNHRRQMRQPDHTLRASIIGVWLGTMAITFVTVILVLRSPSLIMEFWPEKVSWGEARLEFLILAVGVLFVWLGLSRVVSRTVRLTGAMAIQGFLPTVGVERRRRVRAMGALTSLGIVVVLAARWVPEARLVGICAASFLVITALVTFPYARRSSRELSPTRRNRLPLHPLFPGLTIAISIGLALVLPRPAQALLAGWILLGAVLYLLYSRRRSRAVEQETAVVGEVDEVQVKTAPRILIGAGNQEQLPSLLKLGLAMGRNQGAELIVLRVLPTADELSLFVAQKAAEKEWEALESRVEDFDSGEISMSTLVRIAPSVEAGILAAAREYDVDYLLLGAEDLPREAPPSAVLSGVFSSTSLPLVILRGEIEEESLDVIVATSGGPHSHLALQLGSGIAQSTGGQVELVSVVPKGQPAEPAEEAIRTTLEKADLGVEVAHRIVESRSAESGLLESSRGKAVLVVGASIDRLLKRTVLEGLPLEIGRVRDGATLVVKRAEAAMRFWQRRVWEFLARNTPNLTVSERSQVYSQMRHSARADVDFYALISLSSAIAIFGLLLDSGAVIIGAMLVAPLMSPILATAQGIVQGNLQMIQRAGASTFKGMSVSIGVATVITALLPQMLPTGEILARTSPNLLDLGVAVAAGGAAAWAISRSSVAAALPGVAISVALVPPLCVVGYGLGTSQFWISGGAFLLFLTNLAAIIVVGALVFVLVGFRPTRVQREVQVRKAAVIAVLTVALLIIPLGLSTVRMSRKSRIEAEIKEVLGRQATGYFRIWDLSVSHQGSGFLVEGTIYAFKGFETERVFAFQADLQRMVGVPVEVQLTVVPATLAVAGEELQEASPPDSSVLPSPRE